MATLDIPGAYLYTKINEEFTIVLEEPLSELMMKLDPKLYRKYVTIHSKVRSILYVNMHKALYGLLRSALLFYTHLLNGLSVYGFVINPYDICVANMEIHGYYMTVVWHVNDLNFSHK